jgi:hypothetical protein
MEPVNNGAGQNTNPGITMTPRHLARLHGGQSGYHANIPDCIADSQEHSLEEHGRFESRAGDGGDMNHSE